MKIAVVGDFHYPDRCGKLILLDRLKKEKPDLIIGTGDYTDEKVIEVLESIADFKGVKGNVDYLDLPKEIVTNIKGWKIAVFHSSEIYPRGDLHQIFFRWRKENPDVIIFGHTHIPHFSFMDGVYFLNPGSFNGIPSGEGLKTNPSFAVMKIGKRNIDVKFISEIV